MAQVAADLCRVADVESDVGVSAGDAKAQACVTAASKAIARYCNRTFEKSSALTEYPAAYGTEYLQVARPPIVSITSVTAFGSTVDSVCYESVGLNADAGLIYRRASYGVWGETGRNDGFVTSSRGLRQGESGSNGYTVVYVGGFVTPGQVVLSLFTPQTLPEEIEFATRLWAATMFRTTGADLRVASEALGSWSVSYAGANKVIGRSDMPATVAELVGPYVLPFVVSR